MLSAESTLPMLSTLPELPMLKMLPEPPMLKILPTLPILRMLPLLPILRFIPWLLYAAEQVQVMLCSLWTTCWLHRLSHYIQYRYSDVGVHHIHITH